MCKSFHISEAALKYIILVYICLETLLSNHDLTVLLQRYENLWKGSFSVDITINQSINPNLFFTSKLVVIAIVQML